MAKQKYFDRNFFFKWSSDMAYVLGFLFADGNIVQTKRGTNYVAFYSMDKVLLGNVRNVLHARHKLSKRNSRSGDVYRFQIGSKALVDTLITLGLTSQKAKRLSMPVIPARYVGDFVRGYFDGDGNVWVGAIHKNRKTQHMVIQVAFTSASEGFLHELREALCKKGILGGSIYKIKNKECSRLLFSTKDSSKIYEIMYNSPHKLALKRKKRVFERFVRVAAVAQR